MKIGKLKVLALLGLLGLLGLFTGNHGFYGFFGFFAFLAFAAVKSDELLEKNIAKAGLNAFVVTLFGLAVAIATVSLVQTLNVAAAFIACIFIIQIITFIVSLNVYDKKGNPED